MNDELKAVRNLGAELGAAKAENDRLRGLLGIAIEAMNKAHESMFDQCLSNGITNAWGQPVNVTEINNLQLVARRLDAALSQQGEPKCRACGDAGVVKGGDGFDEAYPCRRCAEPASAQDELTAFDAWYATEEAFAAGDSNGWYGIARAAWMARAARPAQTEQQPVLPVESEAWLKEWARGKFTYTGAYKPRVLGQLYGNTDWALARALHSAIVSQLHAPIAQTAPQGKFRMGDLVKKSTGSEWVGHICGTYSTALTPEGYAVESEAHAGSVQIYPANALEAV